MLFLYQFGTQKLHISFVFVLVSVQVYYISLDGLSFSLKYVLCLSLILVEILSEFFLMSLLVFRRKDLCVGKHDVGVENVV